MTREQRDSLRRLAEAATPGEWTYRRMDDKGFVQAPRLKPDHPYDIEVCGEDRHEELYPPKQAHADGEFIAAAKNNMISLLDDLEAAEKALSEIEDGRLTPGSGNFYVNSESLRARARAYLKDMEAKDA